MATRFCRFLFLLLLPFCYSSLAENTILLDKQFESQSNLLPWLSFWQGDKQISLTELAQQRAYFSLWRTIENAKEIPSWESTRFNLRLKNTHNEKQRFLLVLNEPLINQVTLLQTTSAGEVLRQDSAGNQVKFDQRPIKHRHIIFPVDIEANQTVELFILANGRLDRLNTKLSLWQRNAFFERVDADLVSQSIYGTLLILFTIYAGFLVFIVREYSYLWFSVFTFSLFVRIMTQNGTFFEFIWPNWPSLQNAVFILALLTTSASMALFTKAYLNLAVKKPRLSKFYNGYVFMHLPLVALFVLTQWQLQYLIIWMIPTWLFSFLILHTAFRSYREGQGDALAFFCAYLVVIVLSIFSIANHLFSLGLSWVVNGELGEIILITTIAIALSLRIGKAQAKAHMRLAQSRAKNEFLAKMSHEIRTPINGVLGMVQLLQESTLTRKQQHYADVINHCGRTLLNVINDILEYSKIEAGKLALEQQAFCLDELLRKHNEIFWPQIQAKSLSYNFQLDIDSPMHFLGDASRIQQVLNNIFSNAIKFTEHGKIEFNVQVTQHDAQQATLHLMVKDTGIGMSQTEQEKVFAPFVQANSSTSRLFGGSGLGLNITHQLVKLMQGKLHLESQPGVGSCFIIELPLTIDTAGKKAWQTRLEQLKGKQIMLLSNQTAQQDELHQILSRWAIKPFFFQDNSEALNFLEHTTQSVDLIMISKEQALNMPALDKNAWNQQNKQLLIYSSSFANSDTRIFGFDKANFLKQAYSLNLIFDKLSFLLGGGQELIQEKLKAAPSAELLHPQMKILVAEDDATNRLVIRAILKKLQLEHEIVADGKLALDLYSKDPSAFDAIIMDYEMPVLDGCQATAAIRQLEAEQQLKPITIIALTAHVLDEFRERCLTSGMDTVLAKPIIINELIATLNELVECE